MATEKKFRRKNLHCGCCGSGFYTWPEYVDQDQDAGYGICSSCQDWIGEKNDRELDDLGVKIRDALNDKNKAKWDGYSIEVQRHLAMKCIEDGLVTYTIGGRQ